MFRKIVATAATLLVAVSLSLAGVAGAAAESLGATGTSTGPTAYTVDANGTTLPGAAAAFGNLKTLALTLGSEFGWIVIAVLLLQLVVGALAVRAAMSRRRPSQHRAG